METNLKAIYLDIVAEAEKEQDSFKRLLEDISYERKGILYSEMFFLWLRVHKDKPRRIFESGRARGQSTLILAKIFPEAEIISIEHDRNSPDVQVANERLQGYKNVQLLFGDATQLLPKMVKKGTNDVVLIDGPKGFRGLRLAFRLLGSGYVKQVFVHDTALGTEDREFLDKHLPNTLYSDNPILAKQNHKLDTIDRIELSKSQGYSEGKPYGFSLACIKTVKNFPTNRLLLATRWSQFINRLKNKVYI